MTDRRLEAVATAGAGAALAGAVGALAGVAVPAAVVGGVNGAISGWRGIYNWSSRKGVAAFGLDSTWALATTTASVITQALGAVRGEPGYVEQLSHRQNRHVFRRGFVVRPRFAVTFGNSINGVGDATNPRRVRLVTDHEDVHVWQARLLGPVFPALYVGWSIAGAGAGAAMWATRRRDQPFGKVVESTAYYLNPFEWWAYSRDGSWPPRGKVDGIGWKKPIVRSFASMRPDTPR